MAQQALPYGQSDNDPNPANSLPIREAWKRTGEMFSDLYSSLTTITDAGAFEFSGELTTEEKIDAALASALASGDTIVRIPFGFLPYDVTLLTNLAAFTASGGRLVREGGDFSVYDVQAYGAADNGTTSAYWAFYHALAAAGLTTGIAQVPNPAVGYLLDTATLVVPTDTTLRGLSKGGTRLIHGWNGHMFNMDNAARIESLYLDGNGAAFPTGGGLWFGAGNGKQEIRACKIIDFASYCIDFSHEAAGSQSTVIDVETCQLVGTAVGQEAVIIRGTLTALANPRTFLDVQTQGKRFIDLGPCNNLYVVASRIGDVLWSDDSRGVVMSGNRFQGSVPMVIKGANHALGANDIGPAVTVGAGCQSVTLKGNTYNILPIVDAAFHQTNVLEEQKEIDRQVTTACIPFTANDTTPDVGQGRTFQTANSAPTVITYFDGGVNGQCITVRLDANTGITHNNSFIRLAKNLSIATGTVGANDFIRLMRLSGIWFEQSRSFPPPQGAQATYDPPSLADGAGATTSVGVTDAALGDFAEASFSLDLQGITLTAWVSAAGTVSVRFQNESGGTLDLGSGTLRVRVRKA